MNELQKVELDLFINFKEICEQLNLTYFMVSGSALGAVRHGGFIPWDDDLDVAMYRDDYNKFMELAPQLLPENLFLQNYKTDPEFPFLFAKLRNSNTTFVEKLLEKFKMNHGIYMDIFPLDGYPTAKHEQKKLALIKKSYRRKLFCGFDLKRSLKSHVLAWVLRSLGYHKRTDKTLAKYEAIISKYSIQDSKVVCNHGNRYGEKDYIPVEYYGNGTKMNFEGVSVIIPEKYDEYLTSLYGDWRTPPAEDKKEFHAFSVCDTQKSYKEYV